MSKKLLSVLITLIISFQTFANTGWSGKIGDNETLEDFVLEKIEEIYENKCRLTRNKSLFLKPVIELTRLDGEIDYFGASAPTFSVDLKVYNPRIFDFSTQTFVIEVLYNQLSQETQIRFLDDTELRCHP